MPLAALDFTLLHGLHVKAMSLGAQAHPLGAVQDASQVPNADPLMLRGEILPWHRMDSHGVASGAWNFGTGPCRDPCSRHVIRWAPSVTLCGG